MIVLDGRCYLKVLTRSGDCKLRFPTWKVYSHLVACKDKGDTHRMTAWAALLHECKTIPQNRDLLKDELSLIRRDGNRLYALPPRHLADWFKVTEGFSDWDRPDWPDKLWTWRLYRPARREDGPRLDQYDAAVISILYSLCGDRNKNRLNRLTGALIRDLTGISIGTIKGSLARLTALGLIADIPGATPAYFGVGVYNPSPYRLAFFADVDEADDFDPDADPRAVIMAKDTPRARKPAVLASSTPDRRGFVRSSPTEAELRPITAARRLGPTVAGTGSGCLLSSGVADEDRDGMAGLPHPHCWTDEDQRSHEEFLRRLSVVPDLGGSAARAADEAFFNRLRAL